MPTVELPGSHEHGEAAASFEPRDDSHLLPCRHCGVLNGRSASVCWGCESDLFVTGAFGSRAAPEPVSEPAAPPELPAPPTAARPEPPLLRVEPRPGLHLVARSEAPAQVSPAAAFDPEATVPVLVSQVAEPPTAVDLSLPMPGLIQPFEVAPPDSSRAAALRLKWIASGVGVLLVVFGIYVLSPTPKPAASEAVTAPAAVVVPPESGTGTEPDVSTPAAMPVAKPPVAAARNKASSSTNGAAANPKRAVKARAATQRPPVAASAAAPVADQVEPARLPIWPPYPCTPPVAATGLCTMEPAAPAKP